MAFTVGALRGTEPTRGIVDHRLARRMLISQVRKGRLPLDQVCDAHPELIRAARNVGTQTSTPCPICEETDLKLVTYVFGTGPVGAGSLRLDGQGDAPTERAQRRPERVRGRGVRRVPVASPAAGDPGRWPALLGVNTRWLVAASRIARGRHARGVLGERRIELRPRRRRDELTTVVDSPVTDDRTPTRTDHDRHGGRTGQQARGCAAVGLHHRAGDDHRSRR